MEIILKFAKSFGVPLLILIMAHLLFLAEIIPLMFIQPLNSFIIFLFLSLLAISGWFKLARFFFVILFFFIIYGVRFYLFYHVEPVELDFIYFLFSLLCALNLMLFSLIRERDLLSTLSKLCFAALGLQVALIAWLFLQHTDLLNEIHSLYIEPHLILAFPYFQFLLLAVSIVFYIIFSFINPKQNYALYLGYLLTAFSPLYHENHLLAWIIFIAAAGIMTTFALFKDIYRMVFLDELTGLPGRRALKNDLNRLGKNYTIAIIDIDHFKSVNDRYGHDVGDHVLRFIATIIGEVTGGGKAYRSGGEEFTILFPGRMKEEALLHLEALRIIIAERPFFLRSADRPRKKPKEIPEKKEPVPKINITVSIGVADNEDRRATPQNVIDEADKALYRAKQKGRNQVCT